MTYLVDTNVLSEARRQRPNRSVVEWFARTSINDMHISAVTIGEIQRGITQLVERGDDGQARSRQAWLDELLDQFRNRILPVDQAIALAWGRQSGRQPLSTTDGLIVATAAVKGKTLVTRNVNDFARTGVGLLNPFAG